MRRGNWKMAWLSDFSGGLVTNRAKRSLAANQWSELTNVRIDSSGTEASKRGGTTKKTATALLRFE